MDYYFGVESAKSLTFFGTIHITLIALTILIIFLIYKYKEKLKKINNMQYILCGILMLNIVIYSLGGILLGKFDINFHIPIQYCYITGFMFMYAVILKKEKIYNYIYYAIFFCTTSVIIFQDPGVAYDRYHFILLIISHHFLLISSFYTLYVLDYKVNKKGIFHFVIYSFIVYFSVYLINIVMGTSYIFKESLPLFLYEYFPFLNSIPPLIWFIFLSVPMMMLSYSFIFFKNKRDLKAPHKSK